MTIRSLALLAICACHPGPGPAPRAPEGPTASPPLAPALESYALRADGVLVRLELEHGRMTPLLDARAWFPPGGAASLAWLGGRLLACVGAEPGSGALASIDLATGVLERSHRRCHAVAAERGRLLLLREASVEEFTRNAPLRDGDPPDREHQVPFHEPRAIAANDRHVFAVDDRNQLAAIDRTGEATRLDLSLGEGPIHALAATRTRLYVAGGAGIRVFDLATRRLVRTLFARQQFRALTQPRPRVPRPPTA